MPDLTTILAILIVWLAAGPVFGLALIISAEALVNRSKSATAAMLCMLMASAGIVVGGPVLWAIMRR